MEELRVFNVTLWSLLESRGSVQHRNETIFCPLVVEITVTHRAYGNTNNYCFEMYCNIITVCSERKDFLRLEVCVGV